VFQRTAPWVLPRANKKVGRLPRWAYRCIPGAQSLTRGMVYGTAEALVPGMNGRTGLFALLECAGRRHLYRGVPDQALREKLRPRFALGCKRILFSDSYYPALSRENVELVTDRIEEVRADGIRTGSCRNG